jgi:hypothetical protein
LGLGRGKLVYYKLSQKAWHDPNNGKMNLGDLDVDGRKYYNKSRENGM